MKKIKLIVSAVVTLFILGILFSFLLTKENEENIPVLEKYSIEIINAYNDGFATYIEGTLIADKNYEYLQIEIPTYDEDGNKVDAALASVSNIDKGETWKFEAVSMNGVKYAIDKSKVTGW